MHVTAFYRGYFATAEAKEGKHNIHLYYVLYKPRFPCHLMSLYPIAGVALHCRKMKLRNASVYTHSEWICFLA